MKTRVIRRVRGVGTAVASLGLGLFAVPETSAEHLPVPLPPVTDARVDIEPVLDVVAPSGTAAAFDVTVTQHGTVAASGDVTVTFPAGFTVDDALSTGCAGSGNVATCAFGTTQVVAATPVSATTQTYTVQAELSFDPAPLAQELDDPGADPADSNNEDSATFTVVATASGEDGVAAGVVPVDGEIALNLPDGRQVTVSVPSDIGPGKKGVIITIEGADDLGHTCGGPVTRCTGDGFLIKFDESYPDFTAYDPTKPLEALQRFGQAPACRGLGNDCIGMAWAPDETYTNLREMERCVVANTVNAAPIPPFDPPGALRGSPCIDEKYRLDDSNATWFQWNLLSEDPIELPIGRV